VWRGWRWGTSAIPNPWVVGCLNFGWRMSVVLLCGGDKRSQVADIGAAKAHWKKYKRLTRNA
jgi:hypothetical protein